MFNIIQAVLVKQQLALKKNLHMKKLFILFLIALTISQYCRANTIEVGEKLPLIRSYLDDAKKAYSLRPVDTKNKVLIIDYIDPTQASENIAAIQAVNDAIVDGRLSPDSFQAIGIVDSNASWAPNSMIKKYANEANAKMPQLKSYMFFDNDGILNQKFGWVDDKVSEDDLNCVILADKQQICRAIYSGKMTKEQIKKLVDMAVKLSNEPYAPPAEDKKDESANLDEKVKAPN